MTDRDDEPDWEQCDCGRGAFDANRYGSCYTCYLERRSSYLDCIFCGRWHSPEYATCFQCRISSPDRDEAGRRLRWDILIRDDFVCQNCGSDINPQIDHIEPCAEGGTAVPWNLQVLCRDCNRFKGSEYDWRWAERKDKLIHFYFTFGWRLLDDDERANLIADAEDSPDDFYQHARYTPQPPTPQWAFDLADMEN